MKAIHFLKNNLDFLSNSTPAKNKSLNIYKVLKLNAKNNNIIIKIIYTYT